MYSNINRIIAIVHRIIVTLLTLSTQHRGYSMTCTPSSRVQHDLHTITGPFDSGDIFYNWNCHFWTKYNFIAKQYSHNCNFCHRQGKPIPNAHPRSGAKWKVS